MSDLAKFVHAKSGTFLVHRSGAVHQLDYRKQDGSGWWLTDRSGIADRAYANGDWRLLDEDALAVLFAAVAAPVGTETPDGG